MAKHQIIKSRDCIILAGILLLAMAIGSLWDEPVSQLFYHSESPFGHLLAAFGELPVAQCLITAGVLLFMGRSRGHKTASAAQILLGAALAAYGSYAMALMPRAYLPFSQTVSVAVGAALPALTIVMAAIFFRDADRGTMLKVAMIFVFSIAAQKLIIESAKLIWERPRMRIILGTPGAYFTPWWTIGGGMKETLIASGIGAEWFASFPSGHTANGASAMLFALLPLLKPAWRRRQRLLFFAGAAWGLLVAVSRIVLGLHFVTDTVVGFAVMLLTMLLGVQLVYQNTFPNER